MDEIDWAGSILVDVKSATQVEAFLPMTPLPKAWRGGKVFLTLIPAADTEVTNDRS